MIMSNVDDRLSKARASIAKKKAECVEAIKGGSEFWNKWRKVNAGIYKQPPRRLDPNPQPIVLSDPNSVSSFRVSSEKILHLSTIDLTNEELVGANLTNMELTFVDFTSTNLKGS